MEYDRIQKYTQYMISGIFGNISPGVLNFSVIT